MVKLKLKKKRNSSAVFMAMILLVFCIMGGVVFSVERRISLEMSKSAIENLSESLELIKGTIQAILLKEAEFQRMLAEEIALMDDPRAFIRSEHINKTMVKLSLVPSGETTGISSTGKPFREKELDFSAGYTVDGLPFSQTYVNDMGTWAYTIKCPVIKDGKEIASFYVEYIYDTFDYYCLY